jgi:hypothetical protein
MLSIIIPSIRVERWTNVINSIERGCKKYDYEIIFVGPYHNDIINKYKNIKYIRDFGSPNRCQQIGLIMSENKYVTWGSDDCLYKEDYIDKCMDEIIEKNALYLTTGYMECGNTAVKDFTIKSCYKSGKHVDPNWLIFNVAFIKRDIIDEFNFDTQFEVTCIGHTDLACRVQKKYPGRGVLLIGDIMQCEHMPGISGDHKPVHDAQTFSDEALLFAKYDKDPEYSHEKTDSWIEDDKEVGKIIHLREIEKVITWDNWKTSDRIWERRFGGKQQIKFDLGIVVPSIRSEFIGRLYDSVLGSTSGLRIKFIVVGNYKPDIECTYLYSLASPNHCVQQGIVEETSDCEFITWSTDDAVYFPNALANLILDMRHAASTRGYNPNIVGDNDSFGIVKYTEDGPPGYPSGKDDIYYLAITHDDLKKLPGIKPFYNIAPVAVYKRDHFIGLGGLDCRYEHINLSTHDLVFRAQECGLTAIYSKDIIMHCDSNSASEDHRPLDVAHFQNDYPIFSEKYQSQLTASQIKIDINNYKLQPSIWRRFNVITTD